MEQRLEQRYERIRELTYPEAADGAALVYTGIERRIAEVLPHETVDFGVTSLDIGALDGRYVPVIRELGPSVVTAIDPAADALQRGVAAGLLAPREIYGGSLQQWVADGHAPADSAFLLDMKPQLALDEAFLRAISRAVRVGGLVVTSCMEAATAVTFWNASMRHRWTGLQLLEPHDAVAHRTPIAPTGNPHAYLHLWRRVNV